MTLEDWNDKFKKSWPEDQSEATLKGHPLGRLVELALDLKKRVEELEKTVAYHEELRERGGGMTPDER